jgi:hypothetical protein
VTLDAEYRQASNAGKVNQTEDFAFRVQGLFGSRSPPRP